VSDSYPPLVGGATRAISQLAHGLTARGDKVAIITSWQAGTPTFERDSGVAIHRVRDVPSRFRSLSGNPHRHTPPPFPDPIAAFRIRAILRAVSPDLVHTYGWLTYSCLLAMAGMRIPLVLSARDYGNICPKRTLLYEGRACTGPRPGKCFSCASRLYGRPKAALAVTGVLGGSSYLKRRLSALHSPSEYVREVMTRSLEPLHFSDDLNVVLPDYRSEDRDAADEKVLARLPDEPFILFVGALRRVKGVPELLAAYSNLENPPPLVLIGSRAPDTPATAPGVVVIEGATHATVMAAWERALFGVAPSTLPEPLGNVVHEAMSAGRPVIGTRPGGHRDMITDGVSGLLVAAGDIGQLTRAMRRLIGDQSFRSRLGERARFDALRFTEEMVMPKFDAFYDRVLAEAPSQARDGEGRVRGLARRWHAMGSR
jgi:glycosyltransferase involved in cell wall biosynthesis